MNTVGQLFHNREEKRSIAKSMEEVVIQQYVFRPSHTNIKRNNAARRDEVVRELIALNDLELPVRFEGYCLFFLNSTIFKCSNIISFFQFKANQNS